MVAISFSVFKDKLLSGEKTQTIRPYSEKRFNQLKNAKVLHIYWKLRTKECQLLFLADLVDLFRIRFTEEKKVKVIIESYSFGDIEYLVSHILTDDELDDLVKHDGFNSVDEMFDWFYNKYGDSMYEKEFMVIRFKRRS